MRSRTSEGRLHQELPELRWTGNIEFDVTSGLRGMLLGVVQMTVRRDDVEIRYRDKHLGLIDRDRFRRWLRKPRSPLYGDDVTFDVSRGQLRISMTESTPYPVPDDTVEALGRVI